MSNPIASLLDRLLERLTMYRLLFWYLLTVLGVAAFLSYIGLLQYQWWAILLSVGWLLLVSRGANALFAAILRVPANKNSDLITALILALILSPASSVSELLVLGVAAVAAMASKYLLTFRHRLFFNPAALGALVVGVGLHQYASWWIGIPALAPVVLVGGILIVHKIQRFTLALTFLGVYLALLTTLGLLQGGLTQLLWLSLTSAPTLFFATVMLTEPLTSPTTRWRGALYGAFVALLYATPQLHFGLTVSPEEALLIGNLFSFVLSPNYRLTLRLSEKRQEAEGIYSFLFSSDRRLKFSPGQYLEWTVPHPHPDSRGNRRYLTVASAPSEDSLMVTLRIPEEPSSYKRALVALPLGSQVIASQLSGSFLLPADPREKVALIAGGVGITPFRSMIKSLLDAGERRPITLLYSARSEGELAFRDLFDQAARAGIRTRYHVTDESGGPLDADLINQAIPDFAERTFYLSGPLGFVTSLRRVLAELGVPASRIRRDYFPGYE